MKEEFGGAGESPQLLWSISTIFLYSFIYFILLKINHMATPGDIEGQGPQSLGWEALVPRVQGWRETKGERAGETGTATPPRQGLKVMLFPALFSVHMGT